MSLVPSAPDAAVRRTTPGPIDRKLIENDDFCASEPTLTTFLAEHPEVTVQIRARNLGTIDPQARSGGSTWMFHAIDNLSIIHRTLHDENYAINTDCFDCDDDGFFRWDLVSNFDFVYLATFGNGIPIEWDLSDGAYDNFANDPKERTASNDLTDTVDCFGERSGGSLGLGQASNLAEFVSTYATIGGLTPGQEYVLSYWWNARPDSSETNGDLWVDVWDYEPWKDHTPPALTGGSDTWSAAWGDYDGDGDPDLYLARGIGSVPGNRLLRNDGTSFPDVTPAALNDPGDASSSTWVDADNDGDLDLFLANWDGSGNRLWRNDGAGSFQDVATSVLTPAPAPLASAWADYDLDGDVDLFLGHFAAPNALFRNDGSFSFVSVGTPPITQGGSTQGAAWADYDLDGDPDLYVAAANAPNQLFRNDGGTFVNVATGPLANLADAGWGRGCAWGDVDNDGDPDLFVTNDGGQNRLFENVGAGVSFVNRESGEVRDAVRGYGCAWEDVDLDGDLDLFFARSEEVNSLFRNDGGYAFTETVGGPFPLTENRNSLGGAFADIDGDGDVDLAIANGTGDEDFLFRNDVGTPRHWLSVDLQGTLSNRFGLGARVVLVSGGVTQTREVSIGSSYYEQSDVTLQFGLGSATSVTSLTVHWPSGVVQSISPPGVDQTIVIVEADPTGAVLTPDERPARLSLEAAAPNPFTEQTELRFDLPRGGNVRVRVYDVTGRRVRSLHDGWSEPGRNVLEWDGRGDDGEVTPSGVYFVRLEADDERRTTKVIRLPVR
ncbi:MAG: hypothetical protein DHS20C21_21530 [Gemmatimonadota bacterium]|nr:MAG: hypothetical protein DHS20C21_21530 [Gemmatimonadota bacterium]